MDTSHPPIPDGVAPAAPAPPPRDPAFGVRPPPPMGRVNWIGFWTLYSKEVRRYIKVYQQTIAAPVVTTLIFLAIFTLALGRRVDAIPGMPFAQFLAPGLMMMAMVQNAFANTSSSITIAKVQGNIVDVLMPPLSPLEMGAAYALGGVTRGLMVGLVVGLVMALFVPVEIHHPLHILAHAVGASLMLSLMGFIGGIWADKFDHIAAVTNFVVTPLSFLSGTFYSIQRLPEVFQWFAYANPFFYMIDGFRYGFINHSDTEPWIGLAVVGGTNVVLIALAWAIVASGYKLKS